MVKKASKKIWMLKRMKQLGLDEATLVHFWIMEGRCHLETATAVWSGGITVQQSRDLERVQRRALATITSWDQDYPGLCARLGIQLLSERRCKLSLTFAKRTISKSRHKDIFVKLENPPQTRNGTKLWKDPKCRTRRHFMSAAPYLTRLRNEGDN